MDGLNRHRVLELQIWQTDGKPQRLQRRAPPQSPSQMIGQSSWDALRGGPTRSFLAIRAVPAILDAWVVLSVWGLPT
jgi:hypothetical protein